MSSGRVDPKLVDSICGKGKAILSDGTREDAIAASRAAMKVIATTPTLHGRPVVVNNDDDERRRAETIQWLEEVDNSEKETVEK